MTLYLSPDLSRMVGYPIDGWRILDEDTAPDIVRSYCRRVRDLSQGPALLPPEGRFRAACLMMIDLELLAQSEGWTDAALEIHRLLEAVTPYLRAVITRYRETLAQAPHVAVS